jgi:glycosyltransferase involved in cell wall biosynthesis
MKSKLITVIPVFNGAEVITQTLQSVAAQTLAPDRVIVIDNCSTDNTEQVVKEFKPIRCEWRQNEKNLGWANNFNRGLEFADQTEFLHLLCADDLIRPQYYARLLPALESCEGRGLAYCVDERIDDNSQRLSLSGKVTGQIEVRDKADFLREKAEIGNQAISASLLKTANQKAPCQFQAEYPVLADAIFWANWGYHSNKIVCAREPLAAFRWHVGNNTHNFVPNFQWLILDEWKVMQMLEQLRGASPTFLRQFKLKGLYAVRSGIKAKRFRQMKNFDYSERIVKAARGTSGPLAWYIAQVLVEARDFALYTVGRRPRHPKNVYS